jgi:hypothetical protein
MSDSEGVRVSITGDTSGFTDATEAATTAANNFGQAVNKMAQDFVPDQSQRYQQALRELGGTLKDLNPVWLDTGAGAMRLSQQLADAAAQTAAAAAASTAAMSGQAQAATAAAPALTAEAQALADAARMTDMLARGIDPLIAKEVLARAATERSAAAFQDSVGAFVSYAGAADNAGDAAARFASKLNPSLVQQMRVLMGDNTIAADKLTASLREQSIEMDRQNRGLSSEVIGLLRVREASDGVAANFQGLTAKFAQTEQGTRSAADAADFFSREISRIPLADLRNKLAEIAPAGAAMFRTLQENIEAANGMGRALNSAADSARFFQQSLDPTPLAQMRKLMADDIPDAAGKSQRATSGLVREFIVLGHEGIVGNWTRIPGTLLVMTEYSEGLRNAVVNMISSFGVMQITGVAAIGALAAAFVYLVSQAHSATLAINEATNAAVMQGRSPVEARAAMKSYGDQMRDTNIMGSTAIAQLSSSISQLGPLTEEQRNKLAGIMTPLWLAWDRDTKKAGENLAGIFASTGSLDSFAQKERLFSAEQLDAWSKATTAKDKYDIGIEALTNRYGPLVAQIKKAGEEARANQAAMFAGAETPGAGMNLQGPIVAPKLGDFEPGSKQEDPSIIADAENTIKLNAHLRERRQLEAELESAKRMQARASTDEQRADAASAIVTATNAIEMWKAMGDTSWEAKQSAALLQNLANINTSGMTARQLAMSENEMRLSFWEQQAQTAGLTEQQITTARNNAARARIALSMQEVRELDAGQQTFVQSQQEALLKTVHDAAAAGGTRREIAMAESKARIAFWDDEATKAGMSDRQVSAAHIEAARARIQLQHEESATTASGAASWVAVQEEALGEILVGLRAHATTVRGLAEDENKARIKFWDDLVKAGGLTQRELVEAQAQANRARLALGGEELAGGIAAGKQALAARLATLSEEQAANHDNFAKVMDIENQKIALLRAAGASETKQLQDELAKQDNLQREHAAKVVALAEQTLASSRQADTAEIGQRKAELDQEVSERQISKNQEMQILRAFAAEKHALELQGLQDLLATMDPQLDATKTLYNKMIALKAQWLLEDKKLNAEGSADMKRQWDAATAPISSAIDSQVGAMIRGTQTIGQTVSKVLSNVVIGYAEMGVKAATNWASSQLMQLVFQRSIETSKTAASAAGAAARGAVGTGETATENAGLLVRLGRWIATQLGITGATSAGAVAREGVLTAEQVASTQANGLAARLNIAAAAAVAGAWAFADSAMLGPYGLIAAPGVGAAASAEVMAFQVGVPSLDVGAWNVPQDMLANVHAGEMVVPANFASGMRGGGTGKAGSNDVHLNYAPNVSGGPGDMQAMMRQQAGAFKSYLWQATRNGSLKHAGRG